jgi:hypothetical protein
MNSNDFSYGAPDGPTSEQEAEARDDARDDIGRLIDRIDSLSGALSLPIPPVIHLQALREALPTLSREFKAAYAACFGENPWQ